MAWTNDVVWAVAGALLVASSLVPWATRGVGAGLRLLDLARYLASPDNPGLAPRSAGLALFVIPVAGALMLAAAVLPARFALVVRLVAAGGAAVAVGLTCSALHLLAPARRGTGVVLALCGVAVAVVALVLEVLVRREVRVALPRVRR
jgi:hypothetical protein